MCSNIEDHFESKDTFSSTILDRFQLHLSNDNPVDTVNILKTAYDALPQPLIVIDATDRIVLFNKECQCLTGIDADAAVGKRLDDLPFANGNLIKVDEKTFSTKWFSIDGSQVEIKWQSRRLVIGDDHLKLLSGQSRFQTNILSFSSKSPNKEISNLHFSALNRCVLLVDKHGKVFFGNKALTDFLGLDEPGVIGLNFSDIFNKPDYSELFKKCMEKEGVYHEFDLQVTTRYGIPVTCWLSAGIVRNGREPVMLCVFSDKDTSRATEIFDIGRGKLVEVVAKIIISLATEDLNPLKLRQMIGEIGDLLELDKIRVAKLSSDDLPDYDIHGSWDNPKSPDVVFDTKQYIDYFHKINNSTGKIDDMVIDEDSIKREIDNASIEELPKTVFVVPLTFKKKFWGVMMFASTSEKRNWLDWEKNMLRSMCTSILAVLETNNAVNRIKLSEKKLEKTVNIIPDAIAIVNSTKKRVELANPGMMEILGCQGDLEFGQLHDFLVKIDMKNSGLKLVELLHGNNEIDEVKILYQDSLGNFKHGLMSTSYITVASDDIMIINIRDITQVIESLNLAKESQVRALKTFAMSPDPMVILDESGIIDANEQMTQIFGYNIASLRENTVLNKIIQVENAWEFVNRNHDLKRERNIPVKVEARDGRILDCLLTIEKFSTGGRTQFYCVFHDVSEIFSLQQKLKDSLERYRKLTESIKYCIFVLKGYDLLFANQACCELTGYSMEELLSMSPFDLIVPEDRQAVIEKYTQRQLDESIPQFDYLRVLKKNGQTAICGYSIIRDVFDGINSSIVTIHDITELVETKENIEKSNQILETILRTLHDVVFMKDLDGRYTFFRWHEPDGSASDVSRYIGKTIIEAETEDDVEQVDAYRIECQTTGKTCRYVRHIRRRGAPSDFDVTLVPMRNAKGETVGTIGVGRNITDQLAANRKVEELENKLIKIASTVTDIIFQTENNIITYVSPSVSMFGHNPAELLGKSIAVLFGSDILKNSIESGRHNFELEVTDESRIKHDFEIRLIKEQKSTTGVARNISERKNFEKAKKHFLRSIAHEIRNPLTLILGYSELLINLCQEDQELLKMATVINEAAESEKKRINEFFDLDKTTVEYNFEVSSISTVLSSISTRLWMLVSKTARNKHDNDKAQFNYSIDKELTGKSMSLDFGRFSEIFDNLAINAVKYSPADRVDIKLEAELEGSDMIVRLTDKGLGIAEDEIGKIFKPFYQIKRNRITPEGLGLGLANVLMHVEAHGGKISVESKINEGTTFTLSFPLFC